MNTKAIGDATTAMVLARLALQGKTVLVPHGDKDRFDLVLYEAEKFLRIQCKTGRLRNEKLAFSTRSSYTHTGKTVTRSYKGQIEFFGIYCRETDGVYLIPIEAANTGHEKLLTLEAAKAYEIGRLAESG